MKAAILRAFGRPDVLEFADMPRPEPGPGELLIRVEAAGLNRLDHYIREGGVVPDLPFPHILGSDAVGIVEAKGDEALGFEIGDRVVPMPGYPMDPADRGAAVLAASPSYAIRGLVGKGSYAEFMTIPARWAVRAPAGNAAEIAATPMPLVTGVQAIRRMGEVKAGDRVIIHAGASGTGSIMVQIAKVLGAKVAATVRTPEKRSFVESLGADVLPMDDSFVDAAREWSGGDGADVIVDNLGGESLARSVLRCLWVMSSGWNRQFLCARCSSRRNRSGGR